MALLEMRNITKKFGEFFANENVNLSVEQGEVHALLGENGAGKSTLMNILNGMYHQTSGEIYFKGTQLKIRSTRDAIAAGIGMVHQHFMLIPALTVIENVVLGLSDEGHKMDLKVAAERFSNMAEHFGMPIDPWARVETLNVGQQQRLEILKALYRKVDLLILDEPTAVLSPKEVSALFEMIRKLINDNITVIFISHKLAEIMEICDRCTVLCRGKVVRTIPVSEITDKQELANLMIGCNVSLVVDKPQVELGKEVLSVKEVNYFDSREVHRVKDVSLCIRKGEIFGICGVDGSGQSELIRCITGLSNATTGQIFIEGKESTNYSAKEVLNCGIAHIPEDRHKLAMVAPMTIAENQILMDIRSPKHIWNGLIDWKKVRCYSEKLCDTYQVKRQSVNEPISNLSGGNQQKVIVSREIDRKPKLLIAMYPSRGLDISSTKYIQSKIVEASTQGAAVLLVSADLEEVMDISDRIAVMYGGKIMGIMDRKDATIEKIGLLMTGTSLKNENDEKMEEKA